MPKDEDYQDMEDMEDMEVDQKDDREDEEDKFGKEDDKEDDKEGDKEDGQDDIKKEEESAGSLKRGRGDPTAFDTKRMRPNAANIFKQDTKVNENS